MKLLLSVAAITLSAVPLLPGESAAQVACVARYRTSSQMAGEAPGSLATRVNTPCRLNRNIGGVARGRPPGRAGGIDVVEPPRNGRVIVQGPSSLIYTPAKGFSGTDSMLVRMKYGSGSAGGLVRFAIVVN